MDFGRYRSWKVKDKNRRGECSKDSTVRVWNCGAPTKKKDKTPNPSKLWTCSELCVSWTSPISDLVSSKRIWPFQWRWKSISPRNGKICMCFSIDARKSISRMRFAVMDVKVILQEKICNTKARMGLFASPGSSNLFFLKGLHLETSLNTVAFPPYFSRSLKLQINSLRGHFLSHPAAGTLGRRQWAKAAHLWCLAANPLWYPLIYWGDVWAAGFIKPWSKHKMLVGGIILAYKLS